jgi:hypothetical protein
MASTPVLRRIRLSLGKDAGNAVQLIEQALAHSLTGVSDTVQKIIDNTSDLNALVENLQFAKVYDGIKSAADSAFSSISTDNQAAGQFAQALDQIKTQFQAVTDKANQFGLSLDPINAALEEATSRLRDDFMKTLDQVFNSESGRDWINQIEQLAQTRDQLNRDAVALGIDVPAGGLDKLNQATQTAWSNLLKDKTVDDLAAVKDALGSLHPELADLVDSLTATAAATSAAAASLQSIQALLDNLTGGDLSGLRTTDRLNIANDNYANTLALVRGGDTSQYDALAGAGQNAVQLALQAYGNGPQTAAERAGITSNLQAIIAGRSFASGTDFTPPGLIRVGERGPEWLMQSGGNRIFPNGVNPPANDEAVALLRQVVTMLNVNNKINQEAGDDNGRRLDRVHRALTTPALSEPPRRKVA